MLRRDDVRGLDLILLPERVVKLTPTAAEVIRLCDGGRTVDAIIPSSRPNTWAPAWRPTWWR